jgi:hypothetical protein
MSSKGWGFRKARTAFPYLLFLVSYSLFPSVFAPLRALRETKNVQEVQKVRVKKKVRANFEFGLFSSFTFCFSL